MGIMVSSINSKNILVISHLVISGYITCYQHFHVFIKYCFCLILLSWVDSEKHLLMFDCKENLILGLTVSTGIIFGFKFNSLYSTLSFITQCLFSLLNYCVMP